MDFFFDTATVKAPVNHIPEGQYVCVLRECVEKITRDGLGSYLACTFEVVAGQHAGFKFFDRFNWNNRNPVAQDIGRSQFARMVRAIFGQDIQLRSLDVLLGKELLVTTKNGMDSYGETKTETKGFSPAAMATSPMGGSAVNAQRPNSNVRQDDVPF